MTDDEPTAVAAPPGDPASWPATVRDLLRYVQAESPPPAELRAWWRETVEAAGVRGADETGDDGLTHGDRDATGTVERQLSFLESADLIDRSDAPVELARHGREYLDSHDETVLFEGLASALVGLRTVLEALAIRPLTDVEVADLLAEERDAASIPAEAARTHRRWLEALGFLERDGGVNELTRRGRRVVDAGGGPEPPGVAPDSGPAPDAPGETAASGGEDAPAAGESSSGGPAADEPSSSEPNAAEPFAGDPSTGEPAETESAAGRSSSGEPADSESGAGVEPAAGSDGPGRTDEPYARELKSLYDDACALCGDRRRRPDGEGISRVHHLMPPGEPHGGPEIPENAVVVCPNHRADLEHGAVTVDPRTLEIDHAYEPDVSGRTLATAGEHEPGAQYLAYHDAVIAALPD